MTEEQELLVPNDQYLKAGIHIGTKFRTKYMDKFIYKTRPDGLSVLNLSQIDERLRIGANLLAQFKPEEIIVVSRRENGWKPVKKFSTLIGCRVIAGRYPPGMLTNPELATYTEAKMILATDSWPDRNIIKDALAMGIPVMALCDTNNQTNNIDFVIPCNNKGKKSLGLIFYILAREFLTVKGQDFKAEISDFCDE